MVCHQPREQDSEVKSMIFLGCYFLVYTKQ